MRRLLQNNRPSLKNTGLIMLIVCFVFLKQIIPNFQKEESINPQTPKILETDLVAAVEQRFKFPKSVNSSKDIPELMNIFKIKELNCSKVFHNDGAEQRKALQMTSSHGAALPLNMFTDIKCQSFVRQREYITIPLTSEEENFSIAYSIVVFKDLGQVERLFRSIYRPQNVYCFHADKKSPEEFREGLRRVVNCFPNAMMSSRSVEVQRGLWTSLEADLICMKDLLNRFRKWKYLINLTGQEFPLRTNLELVRILKTLNGSNNIPPRFTYFHRLPKEKPNFPLRWIRSNKHIVAVRKFIEFAFNDEKAIQITNLLKNAPHPEEMLFGTLNHNLNLKAPGGAFSFAMENRKERSISRVKHWRAHQPCSTRRYVRWRCIFGIKDLPFLNQQPEMFVNKLYGDFQPFALDCLNERIFQNVWSDFFRLRPALNLNVYRDLDSVRNHH